MLYDLAPSLTHLWGPFRLFGSFLFLIGLGAGLGALVVGFGLPRSWHILPRDRGRAFTGKDGAVSAGKPTGAGFLFVLMLLPVLLLVLPLNLRLYSTVGCLLLAMITGWLDDKSIAPWGDYLKGFLDLGVAFLAALAFCQGKPVTLWLPLIKGDFLTPIWIFLPVATLLLWMTINATNCSDGVDGLAGTLTLLAIFFLALFLYIVIGNIEIAKYLLVKHNPEGANWAVLLTTVGGGLAGYLWHNAEPSRVLMGDAGSRFLGLLVGVAVLASGNPFLILVVATVVLVNGGSGIVKIALLRLFRNLGFDVRTPQQLKAAAEKDPSFEMPEQHMVVTLLHKVRFPLHDHCRKNLGWSNAQVLLRFLLIQSFATPLLFGLLVKIR